MFYKLSTCLVPAASPAANEVLIQVHAVSINPGETKIRNSSWARGKLP